MKTMKLMLSILLIGLATTACEKTIFNSIKGKGENVTEARTITPFTRINLTTDANVIYVKDSVFSIQLTGQANILAVLTTEVKNNELVIEYSKLVRKHNTVTVEVHAPTISELNISGSGKILSSTPFTAGFLKLNIGGSGSISLTSVEVQQLESSVTGSGDITVSHGTTVSQTCTISGSGNLDVGGVESQHAMAQISGSGSITLKALQTLDASISGSGSIKYYGTPAVTTNISGSGSVIHL